MIENFNYILVQIIDNDNHIAQLYNSLDDACKELNISISTYYRNKKENISNIKKNYNNYFIIKIK